MAIRPNCSTSAPRRTGCYDPPVVSVLPGRRILTALVWAALAWCAQTATAQNLTFSFFDRYVEALRQQSGIPGLAGLVIQDGSTEWERGFGLATIDGSRTVRPDTPFPVGGLTQAVTATLVQQCAERGQVSLDAPLAQWVPSADPALTLRHVLAHGIPGDGFRYDPVRYTQLTPVVEACFDRPFASVVTSEILDRLAMRRSVPGTDVASPGSEVRALFDGTTVARFEAVLGESATPYRVDRSGRTTRTELAPAGMNASTGLVASAHDLGLFTTALFADVLISGDSRALGWTARQSAAGRATPGALGWFAQTYKGEPVVWQFGNVADAYSSLIVLLPSRRLSFVLLANSDGLSAPFALANGDVTVSPFATLLLGTVFP